MVRAFDVSGIQTTLFQRVGFLLCQNAYIGVAAFSGAAGVKRGATDRANFRLRCSSPIHRCQFALCRGPWEYVVR